MSKSQANFEVAIHESRPQSSSRSDDVVAVIRPVKVSASPWLFPLQVRTLSLPICGRNLGLPGLDFQLEFAVYVAGRELKLPGHDLELPSPLLLHL
ncbi:unnamed protein product [Linum trigynum]|uniref:Uncharacterized protein n=1 Tax=Linum trigynum TaxID=586398 RepID=A0AAV2E5L2_9ROSI